tara:strand:+ start:252 stop:533 length:282 start_codon:yes stop_codon:yes gene_type:complete
MNRAFKKGLSFGIIGPIGTLLVYIAFFLEVDVDTALASFEKTNTLTHHISLSVFLTNIILFFFQLRRNNEQVARGILAATLIYAFLVIYIKFF